MFIFDGFSRKANSALNSAVNCAEDMGHTYVGSEHILLGLLRDSTCVAGIILTSARISYSVVSDEIRRTIGAGVPTVLTDKDVTPRAGRIIARAISLAASEGISLAGTEHLLYSLLKESTCSAYLILLKCGYSPDEILSGTAGKNSSVKRGKYNSAKGISTLEKFGRNLTEAAKQGKIDPVTGRDREIGRVMRILCRRSKNNPCLIGEPGVGKTAVVEALAYRTAKGDVPERLKNTEIYSLELTAMVAGAKYRGDFEERIRNAVNEAAEAGNIILFIDEIHNLIGAGSAEGAVDAANILKPVLARGTIRLIGATTLEEYRRNIEKDAALERRFQTVGIDEPSAEECLEILRNLRPSYEEFHRVRISDEALKAALDMSVRYLPDRFLPDKAIDLLDEAAAGVAMGNERENGTERLLEKRLREAGESKVQAVRSGDFRSAAAFREEERAISAQLCEIAAEKSEEKKVLLTVEEKHIAAEVSLRTKIPAGELCQSERERLRHLEEKLSTVIIGQDEAVKCVAAAVRRTRAGLSDPERPAGTFLFCGPTGVGKTALAKALAECVFGSKDAIIRLDMSEFSEKHSLSRLIGAPPGYTGFDDGGQLVNKIRRMPYCVLLFDEIEKAHPDTFGFLLPVLEEGILTASDGKKADCRNCIIIMTSNAGSGSFGDKIASVGFSRDDPREEGRKRGTAVENELKKIFPPEFQGRIDETVIFSPLSEESMKKITCNMLSEIRRRLEQQGIALEYDDSVCVFIAEKSCNKKHGARNLRRVIRGLLEDPLSEILYDSPRVKRVVCTVKEDALCFDNIT